MKTQITTYTKDGSILIQRDYDFEEHEYDKAERQMNEILDDSFGHDKAMQELDEHLNKIDEEAEKQGDMERGN